MFVCEGPTGGTGEEGEHFEKVWSRHSPAPERVSPFSVWFSKQHSEGSQCKVVLQTFLLLFHSWSDVSTFWSVKQAVVNVSPVLVALRWSELLEEMVERLRSSKALLQLWQRYTELHAQSCSSIQLQEEQADQLLKNTCSKYTADEEITSWIQQCSVSGEGLSLILYSHLQFEAAGDSDSILNIKCPI